MKQIGKVISINNSVATVQIKRATACGEKCSSCKGCSTINTTAIVNNQIGAKVGETVNFELDDNKILLAAFVVYIVPLFTFIFGYVAFNILYGLAFFIVPFIILKILDKKIVTKFTGKITKIIDRV